MSEEIDITKIEKGTTFDVVVMTRLVDVSPKSRDYPLAIANWAAALQRRLWAIGRQFTVCTIKDGVRVLTDQEASDYNSRCFDGYLQRAKARHRCMKAVDRSGLTFEQKQEHDRTMTIQGVMMHAIKAVRREFARDHQRAHPETPFG